MQTRLISNAIKGSFIKHVTDFMLNIHFCAPNDPMNILLNIRTKYIEYNM